MMKFFLASALFLSVQAASIEAFEDETECTLFIAPSSTNKNGYGVFTGVDVAEGASIGEPDLVLPLQDKFKTLPYRGQHRWLSWLDYIKGTTNFRIPKNRPLKSLDPKRLKKSATGVQYVDGLYRIDAIGPGIASIATRHPGLVNVRLSEPLPPKDEAGLHRSKNPEVGSFTPHHGVGFVAYRDIPAGSELYIDATDEEIKETKSFGKPRTETTPSWLKKNGVCIDNLRVGPSTIPNAGRGAFAKRLLPKGSLIAPSSLAVLKREDLIIFDANETATHYEKVLDKSKVVGTELLMNYAFGRPESDLLFLPLSPVVNFINHNGTAPNAAVRWPDDAQKWFNKHPLDMLDISGKPIFEYVALRDIQPGEEVLIDYGEGWEDAFLQHAKTWNPTKDDEEYVSATDYVNSDRFTVRTVAEQKQDPYPTNLQTVCHFPRKRYSDCWLPCDVETRLEEEGKTFYTALYSADKYEILATKMVAFDKFASGREEIMSETVQSVTLMDKWGSTDVFLGNAFRHEISVPDGVFPSLWMEKAAYEVATIPDLKPGQYIPITFAHNGKPIARNAYFVALPENFNEHMYNYSVRMGAMEMFQDVLNGRYNPAGTHRFVDLTDGEWYVQRPYWNSNMHWIIPYSEVARQSYLQALGAGGFDHILDSIGTGFGLEKLTCFHNTFLGISDADDSNMHADWYESQRRSFNFLVPLIMANSSRPELDLQTDDENVIVGVKYRWGVAAIMGDWTYHKSAAVNYLETGEVRVVSSIYCAEIAAENRKSILKMYHEEYPAPFHHLLDVPVKEWHWDRQGTVLPQ